MDDRIRELRRVGWSERKISAELGVTRHRVRATLARFQPPRLIAGDTWFAAVDLAVTRAKYRKDDEQLAMAELAFDVAEWLDAHPEHGEAERLAGSLEHIAAGVVVGVTPLTRIHARRARSLMEDE